jgi:hypothetical protein
MVHRSRGGGVRIAGSGQAQHIGRHAAGLLSVSRGTREVLQRERIFVSRHTLRWSYDLAHYRAKYVVDRFAPFFEISFFSRPNASGRGDSFRASLSAA